MITEDIFISKNDDWTEISGKKIILYLESGNELKYRFGASSNSNGYILRQENIIVFDESVYVKSSSGDDSGCHLVVSR